MLGLGLMSLAEGKLDKAMTKPMPEEYDKLRIYYNNAITGLSSSFADVEDSASRMQSEIGQVVSSADDLSMQTQSQALALDEASMALGQLLETTNSLADESKKTMLDVEQTRTQATSSREIVECSVSAMKEIKSSSEEIAKITEVIDGIAFQTSLLALNAGVEAARAGSAGRGFAVVASEVRSLAQRTTEAVENINSLVSISSDSVKKGNKLIGEVEEVLLGIIDSVETVSDRVTSMATSVSEQSNGVLEITNTVKSLDNNTQKNAALAEELSAVTHVLNEQCNTTMEEVKKFTVYSETGQAEILEVRDAS